MKQEGCVRGKAARSNNIVANIKKHKPQAEHDNHITYLELGLGIAGAFLPFSPFPSYPLPKVVVLDMPRNAVFDLIENDPVTQNGLEIRKATTLTIGDASAVGARGRTKCIQSAQMKKYRRNRDNISNSIRRGSQRGYRV
jgi:hypothetical protein